MKSKRSLLIVLSLVMLFVSAAASAQLVIQTPQNREILNAAGGNISLAWEPQNAEMNLYIIDAQQEMMYSMAVPAGQENAVIPAKGLLQEGEPYMLVLMLDSDFVNVEFGVNFGGGRNVDWSKFGGNGGGSGAPRPTAFNTEDVDALAKLILEIYNAYFEKMASDEESTGYTGGDAYTMQIAPGEEGALLNSTIMTLKNPDSIYFTRERHMVDFTESIFELFENDHVQLEALGMLGEGNTKLLTNRYAKLLEGELEGGISIEPVEFKMYDGIAMLFFGLTNEKGTVLLDDNLYCHIVIPASGILVSAMITSQEDIAQMLDELGIDRDELMKKLPSVMQLGFTKDRLVETLGELIQAGNAQSAVLENSGDDYNRQAHDSTNQVGSSYKRIVWDKMEGVFDDVMETLIREKTAEELAPNTEWQMSMYKSVLYAFLEQNTEGIGETAAIVSDYFDSIKNAYLLADHADDVERVMEGVQLPKDTIWGQLLAAAMEKLNLSTQSDKDLIMLSCLIAEQSMNESVLNEIALAAGEDTMLANACASVKAEIHQAYNNLLLKLSGSLEVVLKEEGIASDLRDVKASSVRTSALAEINAEQSAISDVYDCLGVALALINVEETLDLDNQLIQLNLVRDELNNLVEGVYHATGDKTLALYPLTKLYLIIQERCLMATERYFGIVDGSWFASAFANNTVTNQEEGAIAVNASREEVRQIDRTLREERTRCLDVRQNESNTALGRRRTAVVNTKTSPLTMTTKPQKQGKTVCMIPKGETVIVIEEGEWPLVEYDGKSGHVDGQYLL